MRNFEFIIEVNSVELLDSVDDSGGRGWSAKLGARSELVGSRE